MAIKTPLNTTAGDAGSASAAVAAAPATTHTIARGETLYRLSKQYGVTVNQLKEWNNLRSNMIYTGNQLIVSDPAGVSTTEASSAGQADVAAANPATRMPAPYSDSGQRLNVTAKSPAGVAQEYHTVRTGETVASIAMKYGYTEKKFREMNDLGANEYPKIGQQLKTNDCDCPETPAPNTNTLSPRAINPYAPANSTTTTGNSLYSNSNGSSSPVNNYSYPSPSSYDQGAQNPNTRPFSGYSDIPVPATGSLTAPNNYTNTNSNTTTAPQSYNYNNYNNTATRGGVTSYNNTSTRSAGMKRSHIVKDGEDLYSIARQYGTTVNILRQLNRMDANEVVIPNQKIYLE
jgi:LysM repeat protein